MDFGQRLRGWRWSQPRRVNQTELARKLGCSRDRIVRLEAGNATPKPAELKKLAKLLGTTEDELRSAVAA